MSMFFVYPNGFRKAMTFSFDDGMKADVRLLEIFNKYNMKCTWNLNSKLIADDRHVGTENLDKIYAGHEIACHGSTHGHLTYLPMEQVITQIRDDREAFEKTLKHPVTGMAYPNGYISDSLSTALRVLGIEYSRTVRNTGNFGLPEDFILWDPTCHYKKATEFADRFLNSSNWLMMQLFYVWGHSYELENNDDWQMMDDFCKKMSEDKDVWHATNMEICRYVKAVRSLVFGINSKYVYNPSAVSVWFKGKNGKAEELKGGETRELTAYNYSY